MIQVQKNGDHLNYIVSFVEENIENQKKQPYLQGEYQSINIIQLGKEKVHICIGKGKRGIGRREMKELIACAVWKMQELGVGEYGIDLSELKNTIECDDIESIVEGIYEGVYRIKHVLQEVFTLPSITLIGIEENDNVQLQIKKGQVLGEGLVWSKNMVNMPSNLLRPIDFVKAIQSQLKNLPIEVEVFGKKELSEMNMNAILTVGSSSEYDPYMVVLRYQGHKEKSQTIGFVGKGVTCDTGGYCLKPSNSMLGIKGDMAGATAVVAAMYALAKNKCETNVIGVIPICENRISAGSFVPGDVIKSYSGKKIEICNTDAEGRLILADAVSYIVKKEKVDCVVDIATLTGAVVNMLGFSTAGVLGNHEAFYEQFLNASKKSGERYWRLPIYEEQETMIKSKIADIKNMGESYCGTITAGIFIREFVENKPWVHLDIAGTAWVDKPLFVGQEIGATGAGMTTLYHLANDCLI